MHNNIVIVIRLHAVMVCDLILAKSILHQWQ